MRRHMSGSGFCHLNKFLSYDINNNNNTGPKPFYIGRKPPRRTRLWAFYDYTNTMLWDIIKKECDFSFPVIYYFYFSMPYQ